MAMKSLFTIMVILLSYTIKAQIWPKVIHEPGPGVYARWLTESYDYGYFIIGPKSNYIYSWIIKLDINGDMLWEKKIGDGYNQCILGGIDQCSDGGFVVAGQINNYDNYGDPVIMKFSPCGVMEWCKIVNTPGVGDYSVSVKSTQDDKYLMLTYYFNPSDLRNRIQLFKFDGSGELLWRQNYPPDSLMFGENSRRIFVDTDSYLLSAHCYYPNPGQTGGGYERPYYIRTDTAGNVLWRLIYGRENGFHGFTFFEPVLSNSGFFYDAVCHSNVCDNAALIKFTSSGQESYFQDLFPGVCPGGSSSINFLNDTTFVVFVAGYVGSTHFKKCIKTDTLGIEKYSRTFTQNWINGIQYSIIGTDNKIVTLANYNQSIYFLKLQEDLSDDTLYTIPMVYDSLCPYPVVSDTIDPVCGLIVKVEDRLEYPERYRMKIYPNPATEQVTVLPPGLLEKQSGLAGFRAITVYHQWGSGVLEVYDPAGKKCTEHPLRQHSEGIRLNVSGWPTGLYLLRLMYRGECVSDAKVMIVR